MGGSIQLDSTESVGTTVSFSLTLQKANAGASVGDDMNEADLPDATGDLGTAPYTDVSAPPHD